MEKDLTKGAPNSVLWRFSLPLFVSVMFQQLYNIADSMIAGRFAGEDALAAVGASYPVTMIFMAVAVGSNIGCSVVISQLFGGKQFARMKTAVSTTMIAASVLSVVLTVAGYFGADFLMNMVQTPENILIDGEMYFRIYIAGFPFLFLYNIATGIFTSLGDSKTPLYFLIFSSVGNVLLDYLFVAVFHWGVAGVAWATFLAQGAACVLALMTLLVRIRKIKAEGEIHRFSMEMFFQIGRIAVPSILQQSFVSIGNIFIQGLVNSFGSSTIAGYSAAMKLNTFVITSVTTLGNGVSSFTAQNIGAGKFERVREGFRAGMRMALIAALFFTFVFLFFGRNLLLLFMKEDSELALQTGMNFLRIVAPFYLVVTMKLIADGVLRGAGAMLWFMITTFSDLILRVLLSFLLAGIFDADGIWMSWPFGWIIGAAVSLWAYKTGKWKSGGMAA